MTKLKYEFSPVIKTLLWLGIIAGFACLGVNVWRVAALAAAQTDASTDYFSAIFSALIGLIAAIVLIAVFFNSYYTVTEKEFVAKYGFFKNSIAVKSVTALVKIKRTELTEKGKTREVNRLELHFNREDFFVIYLTESDEEKLLAELKKSNGSVAYIEDIT